MKLTKKDAFEQIIAILTKDQKDEVFIAVIKHEIELLNNLEFDKNGAIACAPKRKVGF